MAAHDSNQRAEASPQGVAKAAAEMNAAHERPRNLTARQRARAEITSEILASARHQLAAEGAAALSLRAIARDLDMASSAIYRYFSSRDDLLTALILAAYGSVGDVADAALAASVARGETPAESFRLVWRAVRAWAIDHRHEYALIFGSPVPGYQAPQATIGAASRLPEVLLVILAQAQAAPTSKPVGDPAALAAAMSPLRGQLPTEVLDDQVLLRALTSWSGLFGAISFELFGHIHNVVAANEGDRDRYFDAQLDLMLAMIGISG